MSNTISLRGADAESIVLNNGMTSVLIDVLCFKGAQIAVTDWQKEMLVRLARHDAGIVGDGFTGFDLSDILFDINPADGAGFLSDICSQAEQEKLWTGLPYSPDLDLLHGVLFRFKGLCQLAGRYLPSSAMPFQSRHPYTLCSRHGVYLHEEGCILCNNY